MAWDFETDPEFAEQLRWVDDFVRGRIEPLDLLFVDPYDKRDLEALRIIKPLQREVREHGLWAAHLGPEFGGPGFGQLKLALLNEILGRSRYAPSVFGCQAPDSGNAEIIARFGTDSQKERYLRPLLAGDISSSYSMTEPHAGADPALFQTSAVPTGTGWLLNGEKWFSSSARYATFLIVMAVTDPDVGPHSGMSMFIVPADTAGVEIVRNIGVGTEPESHANHGYVRYTDVELCAEHLLGEPGEAFSIAQTRLSGGRIHHAMRTVARVRMAFDMMCERAVSRTTRTGPLGSLPTVEQTIADSWIDLEQFRLLVLRTAWLIDKHNDYRAVRKDIAAVKAVMPRVLHDVVQRAMHLHGALGVSNEMPFSEMMVNAQVMAIADGPTEVHKSTVARQVLKSYRPVEGLWPSGHLPGRRDAARRYLAETLEHALANEG